MKPIFKHLFNLLVLSSLSFSALGDVLLIDGHIRAMPASVPNTAAYFTLENQSDNPVRLVGVNTNIAKEAQLHTIIEDAGMIKMRQVSGFDIPPRGQLSLKATGDHLMLLSLIRPLEIGQKVVLELVFEQGEAQQIELMVQSLNSHDEASQGEHHHHH